MRLRMPRARALAALLVLCLGLVPAVAASPAPSAGASVTPAAEPAPPAACFPETGKCVSGLLLAYWVENGGLERQGFPITDEFDEVSALDGKTYRVQYFERARFEYHQEHVNTPYVVQLGQAGREQFAARYPDGRTSRVAALCATARGQRRTLLLRNDVCTPEAPQVRALAAPADVCFDPTGKCVSQRFYDYWQRTGGLSQHGYPISDEFDEANPTDGKTYRTQYFERARFEHHPEHAGTPYEVLLGLLGREQFAARYPGGQPPAATGPAINVWAATTGGMQPSVANLPPRVYVPHELGASVAVIDPLTFQVVDRYGVGRTPHHVGPSPDLTRLYVNNMDSSALTEIDPQTGKPTRSIPAAVPYNLYFTTDGSKAIVAAEPINALDFYDPQSWRQLGRVRLACSGVDHLDLSADGRYLLVSCEFDGQVVKVDTVAMRALGAVRVGGQPIDIKLSPDGAVFYVANQARHGVSIVDPIAMREVGFLPTGQGAHGLAISRDTNHLYVSNRLAGTISVVEFASRTIVATWSIGGSPDMLQVSPDGAQLWASGRFHGAVYVVDTRSGALIRSIPTGPAPHGITYFPQPGRYSIGHNGVYR